MIERIRTGVAFVACYFALMLFAATPLYAEPCHECSISICYCLDACYAICDTWTIDFGCNDCSNWADVKSVQVYDNAEGPNCQSMCCDVMIWECWT